MPGKKEKQAQVSARITPREVRRMLQEYATDDVRNGQQRYFKETVNAIGVKAPDIRRVAKEIVNWCKQNGGFEKVLGLAIPLWKKGFLEERLIACSLLLAFRKQFDDTTWALCDDWVDDLGDWATCDYLSADIIGAHLEDRADRRRQLLRWAKSPNRWRRRAAAVSLVKHARKGKYLDDVWRVADPLMPDKDDMVRKGVGWLLREAARTAPREVIDFCKSHEHHASRLILRTAAETMPEKLRDELLGPRGSTRGKRA